jgi:pimeloyl-ACP methyl ester carboxylesterase
MFCGALIGLLMSALSASCSPSAASELLVRATARGNIQYTLHSPASPARQRVILAHGFLRSPQTLDHLAKALADQNIETACIALRRSRPWAGNHAENARDLIALRESLGWNNVAYAGFSAGGLTALIAAVEDPACQRLLLIDPVDHRALGTQAAQKLRIPALAILGAPGPGNANRNAAAMLATIPGCRIVAIPQASHCDFEAHPSKLCLRLTGAQPDPARTALVHAALIRESSAFLSNHSSPTN